jgi:hypothetical protein
MPRLVVEEHLAPRHPHPPVVAETVGHPGSQKADTSRVNDTRSGGAPLSQGVGQQPQQRTGTEIPKQALGTRLAAASQRGGQS